MLQRLKSFLAGDTSAQEVGLSPEDELAAAASDVEHANKLYSATRTIRDGFGIEERIDVMQMLWQVAYADGVSHDYEANLVRRVAGLLYVQDQDNGRARKRALENLGLDDSE